MALSYGSRLILDRLGVWRGLQRVSPIRHIHISQRASLGQTQLHAEEEGVPELGYVVDYAELDAALHAALRASPVQVVTGARVVRSGSLSGYAWAQIDGGELVTSRLLAIADGGASDDRRLLRDYNQHALLAWVSASQPRAEWAFERFTEQGPVALLPQGDGYALVWTGTPERVQTLLAMPDSEFLRALHAHFGDRVGEFLVVRDRSHFPLVLSDHEQAVQPHRVMIGNAAHVMHPVAGQGFNLGLRDAWELAQLVLETPSAQLGEQGMLSRYARRRRVDVQASMWFTDSLVRLFSRQNILLHHVRGTGLMALQKLPPVRHFVARRMLFGARAW